MSDNVCGMLTPAQIKVLRLLRAGFGHMSKADSPAKRGARNTTVRQVWRMGYCKPNKFNPGQYVMTPEGYQALRVLDEALKLLDQEVRE